MATKYRKHECFNCGTVWEHEVIMSKDTQNLSGERTVWCPGCGKAASVSYPIFEK